jgi:hypothetical protein
MVKTMDDVEAEARQILSEFRRRKSRKSIEAEAIETLEADLSKEFGFQVKLTKHQAIMVYAEECPKPTDKGGRGIRKKPLPGYASSKRLQQARYIFKNSKKLAQDVMAGEMTIDAALHQLRHGRPPEVTAIHESGHVIIGLVLGLRVGDVTIMAADGDAGLAKCGPEFRSERMRPAKYAIHADAMVSMAGTQAELEIQGKSCGGDRSDRANIDSLTSDDKVKARLRLMTRMLVRRHRLAIEHVAETLVDVGTLSGRHIDEWWKAVTKQRHT